MSRRRWPGGERGSFTAEFAAGLPALLLLLFVGITLVNAVATKAQCVDAAREGALAAARGEPAVDAAAPLAPDGATIDVAPGTDTVTVTVQSTIDFGDAGLPLTTVIGSATSAREPAETGPAS